MSGLASKLRQATRPTAEEETRLIRGASGVLIRSSVRVLRPERGELERLLRGVPAGRGARRYGVAPVPEDRRDLPAERPKAVRSRALAALIGASTLGVAGLAKAAPSVRAVLADGIDVLALGMSSAPPTSAEIEAATCGGTPEPERKGEAAPAAAVRGLAVVPSSPSSGLDAVAAETGGEAIRTARRHPNPRLAYMVGGMSEGPDPAAAPEPAVAEAGPPGRGLPHRASVPVPPGAVSPTRLAGRSHPAGAPIAPMPAVPGLDGPALFTATALLPDPNPQGDVEHHVDTPGAGRLADMSGVVPPSSCPVWPGEPGAPVFLVPGEPPSLQPAAVVATAPSVMTVPTSVGEPAPARSGRVPGRTSASKDGGPRAVPHVPASKLPRPAPSRRVPVDLSAAPEPLVDGRASFSPALQSAPVSPSAPAAPAAPSSPPGSAPLTEADSAAAATRSMPDEIIFGAGRGATDPDPGDCESDDSAAVE